MDVHILIPLCISFRSQCTREQMPTAWAIWEYMCLLESFGVEIILISMVKTEMWVALSWEQVIRQGKVGCSTELQRSPCPGTVVVALQRGWRGGGGVGWGPWINWLGSCELVLVMIWGSSMTRMPAARHASVDSARSYVLRTKEIKPLEPVSFNHTSLSRPDA